MAREKHNLRGVKNPDAYEDGVKEESNLLLCSVRLNFCEPVN